MLVYQFVVTGGPCAGKTTALSILEQTLTQKGYKVIVMPETATEIISSGIRPTDVSTYVFQKMVLDRSINKEETMLEAIRNIGQNVVILYDRGILDGKAYMDEKDFSNLLKSRNLTEISARSRYDAVFHLVSAANGAEAFYTLENNKARTETLDEAIKLDEKTLNAWIGHPHLRVIDNSTPFKEKIDRLISAVFASIGLPIPTEIERKYLIEKPDLTKFIQRFNCTKLYIYQVYLCSDENKERRIRQTGDGKDFSYYYTEKSVSSTGVSRTEKERRISQSQFLNLLMQASTSKNPIRKIRYCFIYANQYFELDVYPEWEDKSILELKSTSCAEKFFLPEQVTLIADVTNDPNFRNSYLATKKFQ